MDENKIPDSEAKNINADLTEENAVSVADETMADTSVPEKAIEVWENRPKKRLAMTIFLVITGVILAFILAVLLVVDSYLDKINKVEGPEPTISQEEIDLILGETDPPEEMFEGDVLDIDDVVMPELPADKIQTENYVYNILLIGQDRRPGEKRARSDSMILCTINTKEKTLVMTSFLRDLYVRIPDYNGKSYADNRLNVPYALGGMEMLNECLEMNFGVQVDHNVEVDFSGFEKIIDTMGGVGIELTQKETRHVPGSRAGWNHLNGKQALAYARIRKIDNDFGRTNRQRKVLLALIAQLKYTDLETMMNLAEEIFPMITTDMTNADILTYLAKFAPLLSELEITTQQIPASDAYRPAMIRGMSVLVPDIEKCCEQLKDTIG